MSELIEIAKTDELHDGEMKTAKAGGREVLLARIGDKYYVTDVRCTHMGGNLAEGTLNGTIITCPRHGSQFDLSTGQVVRWLKKSGFIETLSKKVKHERPLTTFNVKIEGSSIKVEI